MRALLTLSLCLALSVSAYLGVFTVVHKPLTGDTIDDLIAAKKAIALRTPAPRLFILAGSNGRFSHRCETLEPLLGRPCVNLSTAAGIGLDYVFAGYRSLFRPGDALYLPLEYEQYMVTAEGLRLGPENALLYRVRHDLWPALGWRRVLAAAGSFDLSFLIQATAEMALHRAGVQRRYSLATLSPQGDESGHDASRGAEYRAVIRASHWQPPGAPRLGLPYASKDVIDLFVRELQAHGVVVAGGLPTTLADRPPAKDTVAALRAFYRAAGAGFVEPPGGSLYPHDCFYDSTYHLNEGCQVEHSRALAAPLKQWLDRTAPASSQADP